MQEIGKFGHKINLIPNAMKRYVAFMLGKNLELIDSMQFMNSRLENLVKNLPKNKFKYLPQEFSKK